MKTIFALFCSIFLALGSVYAQSKKLVEIPSDLGIVSVLKQPDSPMSIDEIQLLTDEQGGFPKIRYVLRNNSSKEVVSFAVGFRHRSKIRQWQRHGNGWTENIGSDKKDVLIEPNGVYESVKKDSVGPNSFDKDFTKIFGIGNDNAKLVTFWVAFVKEVRFKDGTAYDTGSLEDGVTAILLNDY